MTKKTKKHLQIKIFRGNMSAVHITEGEEKCQTLNQLKKE